MEGVGDRALRTSWTEAETSTAIAATLGSTRSLHPHSREIQRRAATSGCHSYGRVATRVTVMPSCYDCDCRECW